MQVRPAAILIENKSVLTLRYNYNGTDVFMLPGGNLEFGESLEACLIRELEEELGLPIKIKSLFCIAEVHQADADKLHCAFLVEKTSSTIPKINPAHTSALELVFLPFEKLKSVALYPHIPKVLFDFCVNNTLPESPFLGEIVQRVY
jgi:8-oxo-dGTP diphosphatase